MISISGVRGIVGETLTPELLTRLGQAYGTYLISCRAERHSCRVIVGRDTRTSSPMVKHSVLSGLLSTGCEVIDLDISTTPTCQLMIQELNCAGGIVISGSHNPAEWNALKFFQPNGIYLNASQAKELLDIYYQGDFYKASWEEIKPVKEDNSACERHIQKIISIINLVPIQQRKPKVVIDSCNGAGAIITPILLERLCCEVVKLHCDPNGLFPHNPEPTFVNLGDLSAKVVETAADIGFAQDADADRVAIVTEKGEILSEEYSLALVTKYILQKNKGGTVVTNLSTTKAIDDIAKEYGAEVIRTPVGEVNVAEKMKEIGAVIGGEGNGGIIDPRVHYARDSLVGISLILQYVCEKGGTISEIVNELPKYYTEKRAIECSRGKSDEILSTLRNEYSKYKIDTRDGIKIYFEDSWVHIRRSNTEPILRVITESKSKKKAVELNNALLVKIEELLRK